MATLLCGTPSVYRSSRMSGILLSTLPRDTCPEFFIGDPRAKDRRPRAGVWFLGRGQHCSNPIPHQLGAWESAASSPAGLGAELRSPKGFSLFSALRMASPDTIILLIVDYHAVIGGQNPRAPPPLAYAPSCGM